MSVRTGEEFYEHLQESRLLTAEQLADVHDEIRADETLSAARLANDLVSRGSITLWQARQLLSGRHDFFVGKYKLMERLGAGGMGTVFKAYHAMTDRLVALKLVNKALLANPPAVARFRTEVRLICSLNHPNIITAYDADSVGDMHFLVMEFGHGRDLRGWLKEYGPLPIDWACDCIRQAALALDHAHQRGLVHRDIKPENILADGADAAAPPNVKLLDMGLARLMHEEPIEDAELAGAGKLMGTPDYISPEQATHASSADIRSDIYSLGATLYKILTGEAPFEGGDVRQRLMARLVTDAPRVSSRRDDLPDELDEIVARMLAREPQARYQSPSEVAQALLPFTFEGRKVAAGANQASGAPPGDAALDSFFIRIAEEPLDGANAATVVATIEKSDDPAPLRAADGGRQYDRRNWLVGLIAGCAISAPVVALLLWARRPATLVLRWPLDERRGAQLLVDGAPAPLPTRNPAEVSLSPGKHRVVLRRRGGYAPIEWNIEFGRGDRIEKQIEWEKTDLKRPFHLGAAGK